MKKGNREKSNRAQADYFELLVCQHICSLYDVTFSYSQDIAELISKILKKKDGENRLKTQTSNFQKICPEVKRILESEIKKKGKIVKVTWVGRYFVLEQTTSDVDAEHKNHNKTRFSIKSIEKQGTGTLKNLGLKNIQDLYHFDFSPCVSKMWDHLRERLKEKIQKDKLTQGQMKKWLEAIRV